METLIKKYRFLLLAGIIVLAALSFMQFDKLRINPSFNDYIPSDVGNRAYMQKLDSIFGGNEKIMLIITNDDGIINPESYSHLVHLTDELADVDGVERSLSLRDVLEIKLEDGFTSFDPIIHEIPADSTALRNLENRLLNNEMGKRFVSADLTATAIILSKSNDVADNQIIPAIQEVLLQNPGKDQVYIGGLSYIRQSIKSYIKTDLVTLLPAALILMILMLYFSFKEWKGVVLPFVVVILSIIFSFGLMGLLGWEISLISVLLPIMLIAIANDYSIHLVNLYQEKYKEGKSTDLKIIAVAINRELRKPIIITALTTIGGMLGLLSHKMAPAAQLGVLASFGIGLALLMSLYLVPVLLSFYPKPRIRKRDHSGKKSFIDRILTLFSDWITQSPQKVLCAFALVAVISIAGLFLVKVDTNVESYFIGKSDIKKGIELVNEKFGGSQYVSILFEGDVLAPETLRRMDEYTHKIQGVEEIGHIISPSIFMRELSKGMNTPEEAGYGQLPKTEAEAEQYFELLSMTGYDGQVSQFIDYNYEHARILVSLKDGSNRTGKKVLKALKEITEGDPAVVCIAGPGLSKIQIADMVIHGQISSMILALAIIFILLALIFRSFAAGTKGSLPLLLSSLFLFGLMGFLNIPLDIVTAMLSSIMIGVGVDYTIHFLWRYKAEYASAGDRNIAVARTLETAGRGIVFNAFSVIVGFSVLIFSSFAPLRFFGVLVVVSIFSCLICALLLIPAIIIVYKPRFLES
ncbi:efflux RND transporter permease subunit [Mangrovibacterium lignilyticum]|uniref:efflux RND transporter permease subunit n=1 Tax=Mangrovibacterium lignilyticum TaxID=2668052 RepID=UPI001EE5771D|nr:efflux RND transporter permease subunit [Mangrovibacterium lignilyticum]